MGKNVGEPPSEDSSSRSATSSGFGAAYTRGLKVFGGFVAVAAVFFIVTFGPYKTVHGMRELPLPTWVMLLPTLVSLGAGVIIALTVTVVTLVRDRHRGAR